MPSRCRASRAGSIDIIFNIIWTLASPRTKRLGTPNVKRFRGLLIRHCYDLLSCSPPFAGGFYFRAFDGSVTLPVAGYNYGGNWKIPPAGLSPAGSAASVAAHAPGSHVRVRATGLSGGFG